MKQDIQDSFRALVDPTRRMILMHLSKQDMTIGEVTEYFGITRAAVKKHLNILESGKLISVHKNGRQCINRLEPMGLKPVSDWMSYFDSFWNEHLNHLKHAIASQQGDTNVK